MVINTQGVDPESNTLAADWEMVTAVTGLKTIDYANGLVMRNAYLLGAAGEIQIAFLQAIMAHNLLDEENLHDSVPSDGLFRPLPAAHLDNV